MKEHCSECGGSQIPHTFSYVTSCVALMCDPLTSWLDRFTPVRSFDLFGAGLLRAMLALGLATKSTDPSSTKSLRTKALWDEARSRGIEMTEYRLSGAYSIGFTACYKGKCRYFEQLPRPRGHMNAWMDYKSKMKAHFKDTGIPVAEGGVAFLGSTALKIFDRLKKPVIVKPNDGSRSRHTRVHISDRASFVEAFRIAKQISPLIMIEEELSGFVYRGTLVGKKLIAVVRREPACVYGDGTRNVRELLEEENRNPKRQGPIFQKISLEEAKMQLKKTRKDWDYVPQAGEYVELGTKTSRGVGGGLTDVTEQVHADNVALLEKVAAVVDDPLIGVDLIMEDMSRSWKEQPRSGVIECNGAPFIDLHHYPLVGTPQNVAGALWDLIFPASEPHRQ